MNGEVPCEICKTEFVPSNKGGKYCSQSCFGESQKGRKPWNKGIKASEDERVMRCVKAAHEGAKGHIPWNKGKKGIQVAWNKGKSVSTNTGRTHFKKGAHVSKDTQFKKGNKTWSAGKVRPIGDPWNKGKPFVQIRGEKHHAWKGGITSEATKLRNTPEQKDWSRQILRRDDYTCFFCAQRGGKLNADHIKPFDTYPELRLELSNGRTVCEDCHKKTPTYGVRGKLGPRKKVTNKAAKRLIVDLSFKYKLSHLGSNLGAIDVIIKMLKKKKPNEKFFLSAGHYGIAYYAALETLYGHNAEQLFLKHGTHCGKDLEKEIWCVNGSLGCVVSIALGAAMADRTKDVYCLLSDGELAEGSTSEAIRFKAGQKLDNLKIYVNANGLGAYSVIDVEKAMKATLSVDRSIQFCYTTPNQMPFLNGLDAHYHIMNGDDYKVALEVLA